MPKVRKVELSCLYVTHCLILFYISTNYHQNIPKGIGVTEWTLNLFQTKQREITPKVRKQELSSCTQHIILSCSSTILPLSSKSIPKGIQVTEQTRSFTPTPMGSVPNTVCPPTLQWLGMGEGSGDIMITKNQKV